MAILLGTQNWNYRAWIGPFYPPETKTSDLLQWYSRMFSTIEVDSTFYGVPAEAVVGLVERDVRGARGDVRGGQPGDAGAEHRDPSGRSQGGTGHVRPSGSR